VHAEKVGQSIRSARSELGLTQAEVAERFRVAAVEAGRENLNLGQLANIASAMGVGLEIGFPVPSRAYKSLRLAKR
jgi:transcriptional regulator with XRE-family HTH domain